MSSHRELLERRERLAWIKAEEQRERDAEDRREYEFYRANFEQEQARVPPAEQLEPLNFDKWRSFMIDEPNPTLRGLQATNRSLWQKTTEVTREIVAGSRPLLDSELEALGYDISNRCEHPEIEVGMPLVAEFCRKFIAEEPRFDKALHLDAITHFLETNRLFPSTDAFGRTFSLLLAMNLIEPKLEPEPTQLNEHGVNLSIERDPELEREQRRRDYFSKPVVTDRRDGRSYTQYELDKADANTYRAIVFGEFSAEPRISDVIKCGPGMVAMPIIGSSGARF